MAEEIEEFEVEAEKERGVDVCGDEDRLSVVAERALRGPRRGVYEQILADLLIRANRADDGLKKIWNVCQAAFLSNSKQNGKFDMSLVEVCFAVSSSFLSTVVSKDALVTVAWSFPQTEENWKRYVSPWHRLALRFYPLETPYGRRNYPRRYVQPHSPFSSQEEEANMRLEFLEALEMQVAEEIRQMPVYKSFFQTTTALSVSSFYALKAEFEGWAISKLALVQADIAEEIDPQIYREMLELSMRRQERGERERDGEGKGELALK